MLLSALFNVLMTITPALAAPVNGTGLVSRQFMGDDNAGFVDWIYIEGGSTLIGVIEEPKTWGVHENCHISTWADWHNRDGDNPGYDAYVYCIQTAKHLAWDIRRMGETPINCQTEQVSETWSFSKQETTTNSINIEAGGAFEFFSASIGYGYSDTVTNSESYTKQVSCGEDFKDIKCNVGGHAVIETIIKEGWVTMKNRDDGPHEWYGWDDEGSTWGMREYKENAHYKYSTAYEGGWYTWDTTGRQNCQLNFNNRYYSGRLIN